MSALSNHPLGMRLCAVLGVLCFVAVALLRLPLVYVLAGLGIVACTLTYRKIKP
jgi:chromate transporter